MIDCNVSDFLLMVRTQTEEAQRVTSYVETVANRIVVTTREVREIIIQAFLTAAEAENEGKTRGATELAEKMQLLFDFRDLKSTEKTMKTKSLETQIHQIKSRMNKKK